MQELPQDILGRVLFFLHPCDLLSLTVTSQFLTALTHNLDATIWGSNLDFHKKKFFTGSYKLTFLQRPEYRIENQICFDTKGKNYFKQKEALLEILKPILPDKIFSRTKIKTSALDYMRKLPDLSSEKLECMCVILFHDDDKLKKIRDKDLLLELINTDARIIPIVLDYSETNPPDYVKLIDAKVLQVMKEKEINFDKLLENKPLLLQQIQSQRPQLL